MYTKCKPYCLDLAYIIAVKLLTPLSYMQSKSKTLAALRHNTLFRSNKNYFINSINQLKRDLYNMDLQKQKHQYLISSLDYLKEKHGVNNTEAANLLDVSQPYISQLKRAERAVTDNFLSDFVAAFKDYNIKPFTPSTEEPKLYKDLSLEEIEGIADKILNDVIELKGYITRNKKK